MPPSRTAPLPSSGAGEDQPQTREMFYAEALNDALRIEMQRDPKVIVLGEDIAEHGGAFQVTAGLLAEFGPERIRQTPISEIGLVGTAVGAALTGLRPVAELMYIDFSGLAMDQIVNQAAQNRFMFGGQARVPLVVRTQGGSGRGNAAQHSKSLEAWFTHVAGLKVVMPAKSSGGTMPVPVSSTAPRGKLLSRQSHSTNSSAVRAISDNCVEPRNTALPPRSIVISIVTWSRELLFSLEAAATLADEGISAEVIDVRSLVPLDKETILASVRKTRRVLVVHEAIKRGGYGGEIAALIAEEAFDDLDAPPRRLAGLETPIPYAQPLELGVVPQVADIVRAARELATG